MANDLIPLGRPRNSHKKDFLLFVFVGGRGGGGMDQSPPTNRYTYWIDHNPFATAIKQLVAQNVSFDIWSTSDGFGDYTNPVDLWCRIEQSNDCPDEIALSADEIAATRTLSLPHTYLPPYYINTKFLSNPTDFNYQNDQGRYVYNAYSGNGFGLGRTAGGAFDAIFQSFVPQSPVVTGVWLKDLFRIGSTSDHTLYSNITLGLYDSSLNLVGTIGKLNKGYPLTYGNSPPIIGVNYNNLLYVTADDGHQYWTNIDQIQFVPDKPIPVKVGGQYYIGVIQDTLGTAFQYGVGNNADNSGNYNSKGRYIFGQAYTATKTGAVFTSVSAIATNQSICFVTQRNTGRTAYNFIWNTAGNHYWNDPAQFTNQFKFVKEDFDQRI